MIKNGFKILYRVYKIRFMVGKVRIKEWNIEWNLNLGVERVN